MDAPGWPAEEPRRSDARLAFARVRRMKRCALAVLLSAAACYAAAQVALFLCKDALWKAPQVKVEVEKLSALRALVAEAPDRPLVLMLGSSRTDWAFQAGRLNGQLGPDGRPLLAFNLGVPLGGALHESLYLHDLLAEGIRPRLLLVEFVSTQLNHPRSGLISEEGTTETPWMTAAQLRYFAPYFARPARKVRGWLEVQLAPWYALRCPVHNTFNQPEVERPPELPHNRPMDQWGWRMLISEVPTEEYRALRRYLARDMYAHSLQNFRLAEGPARALHDLLARCRHEQIPVALVLMPTSAAFRELYPPDARAAVQGLLDELRQRHGVEVIDATDWLPEEDFDDGHHVLLSGAQHFTSRLIDEVQRLLR
jgi:hypothetical protein